MLQLKNIYKTYGELTAVSDLSLSIQKGEVLGLLGHNGAGKSTTIKMILGILDCDAGEILWDDKKIKSSSVKMGYLPEERGLYEKTKVYDQLYYFGKLENMKKEDIIDSMDYWLARLGITQYKHKTVQELSKGNKQKIQLIAAIIHDPELIILDEPFSGLDPINANVFADVIKELIEKKKTIILSSHRMEQLDMFCKNILIMKKGNTIVSGDLDEIKKGYGVHSVEIKCEKEIESFLEKQEYTYEKTHDYYLVSVENETHAFELFEKLKKENHHVRHFVMREPNLHEIFVEVMGK